MDTIALHEAGFTNTVAVSGTALTEKHIQMIKRLTHKIYLCFDNDSAGEAATKASLELLKNKDLEVKIILLEGGKDPDEILKKGKDFSQLIQKSVSPIAFAIRKSHIDAESLDEKKKFLTEILAMIQSYADNIEKDMYLKEVAKILQIHEKVVYDEMRKLGRKTGTPEISVQAREEEDPEMLLIAYLLEFPDMSESVEEKLLFKDGAGDLWKEFEAKKGDFLGKLSLEKREKLRALNLQLSQEEKEASLPKILQTINKHRYKKLVGELKKKMDT